ncbi:MAG: hypothetical protein P8J37_08185 [Fuerstiella sp.]|nr:hypothetical protein [Fuerstiella sp.]
MPGRSLRGESGTLIPAEFRIHYESFVAFGGLGPSPSVQEVLPGLPSGTDAQFMSSAQNNVPRVGSNLEALIPDPAIYKFETGTGYEVRPVIQPDGQSVVFHIDYTYTTNVREPVRADEKHLGRVNRHFINTDVVSGNYELRELSTYRVGLKASRTSRGVPLLEDVPGLGVLFRPLPSEESSLQENIILSQTVIYPTPFDLMGLRWAPAVADLDTLSLREREFVTRNREKCLQNKVFDYSSLQVDEFMRIPDAERRGDLYRTQESIPQVHPNGYNGSGLNIRNGLLQEGYAPERFHPQSQYIPQRSEEARFPLEQPPKTPILTAPVILDSKPSAFGNPAQIPGTAIPFESLEGALPIESPCPPGRYCPPTAAPAIPLPPTTSQIQEKNLSPPTGRFCPVDETDDVRVAGAQPQRTVPTTRKNVHEKRSFFTGRNLTLPAGFLSGRKNDRDRDPSKAVLLRSTAMQRTKTALSNRSTLWSRLTREKTKSR